MKTCLSFLIVLSLSLSVSAKITPKKFSKSKTTDLSFEEKPQKNLDAKEVKRILLKKFSLTYKDNKKVLALKRETLNYHGKAVPALITIMKDSKYPEKNRWIATFLLGKVMGKKAAPFIAKFLRHPSWVMRMASLKTLLALKQKDYGQYYARALKDNSFIVRTQALENIRKLNLKEYAPNVWAMLYDKKNYYSPKKKAKKRTNLIKRAIKTVGELRFGKAKEPLFKMVQKKKYEDIFSEMDYSLAQILGKKSPDGGKAIKRRYWKKIALKNTLIR
jgi:hypothetical protein